LCVYKNASLNSALTRIYPGGALSPSRSPLSQKSSKSETPALTPSAMPVYSSRAGLIENLS
jgi:hypothetical protein